MSDLTPENRRQIAKILRDQRVADLTLGVDALDALAEKVELDGLVEEIREVRERVEKQLRDALVDQVRTLIRTADTLSSALGHTVALLSALDAAELSRILPSLTEAVEAGRGTIQAWHQVKAHVDDGLAAMDEG